MCILITGLVVTLLLSSASVFAIEFIQEDNKGHYHFRCNESGIQDTITINFILDKVLIHSHRLGIVIEYKRIKKDFHNAQQFAKLACNEFELRSPTTD